MCRVCTSTRRLSCLLHGKWTEWEKQGLVKNSYQISFLLSGYMWGRTSKPKAHASDDDKLWFRNETALTTVQCTLWDNRGTTSSGSEFSFAILGQSLLGQAWRIVEVHKRNEISPLPRALACTDAEISICEVWQIWPIAIQHLGWFLGDGCVGRKYCDMIIERPQACSEWPVWRFFLSC